MLEYLYRDLILTKYGLRTEEGTSITWLKYKNEKSEQKKEEGACAAVFVLVRFYSAATEGGQQLFRIW